MVLIDIPACIEGYHADQSRMYAVGGTPSRAKDLFEKLREVADHIIRNMRPGVIYKGPVPTMLFLKPEAWASKIHS